MNFCPHIKRTSAQTLQDYRNTALWRDLVLAAANVHLRHRSRLLVWYSPPPLKFGGTVAAASDQHYMTAQEDKCDFKHFTTLN
jgi:hypothetical protein